MFSAPTGHEARLLELAYELEDARPWARIDQNA
jgi:amidase